MNFLAENDADDLGFASVDVSSEMALEIQDIIERVPTGKLYHCDIGLSQDMQQE